LQTLGCIKTGFPTAPGPPKANRTIKRDYDKHTYKWRHLVKNFFAKIEEFRAIATRYEKTACSYAPYWHLVATIIAFR
jgi:transposase